MKPNKKVIGITGTIAAGKSTAAGYFRDQYGIPVIDADIVGHEVLRDSEVIQQLVEAISPEILVDGVIDRKILGSIVFKDAGKLAKLNAVSHPAITRNIAEKVNVFLNSDSSAPFMLIEAYGLLQSDLIDLVSEVWVVCADRELRIQRVMERQGLSADEAERRVNNQWSDAEYIRKADVAFDGSRDAEYLKKQCDHVMEKFCV